MISEEKNIEVFGEDTLRPLTEEELGKSGAARVLQGQKFIVTLINPHYMEELYYKKERPFGQPAPTPSHQPSLGPFGNPMTS